MKKDYKKLELDKILDLLSQNAYCDVCRERIKKIKPSFDIDTVRTEIAKTDDAFTLSSKFGTPKFYNIKDICFGAKRAQQGSSLSLRELMDIGMFLREVSGLDEWYSQCSGIQTSLTEYFEQLSVNKHLENMITNAIISEEELADSASPQLAAIRRSIQRKSLAARERLDKLIGRQSKEDRQRFAADVSFVGSMYHKNSYDDIKDKLPPYMKGYFDAAMLAQLNIFGDNIIDDLLTVDILKELSEIIDFRQGDRAFSDIRLVFESTFLGFKLANIERVSTLNRLSKTLRGHNTALYTDTIDSKLEGVDYRGAVAYMTHMPLVFNNSRINLNMTIRNIRTGIPLRVWDILGAGGFLLTNFQVELPDYFENGKDIVYYEDINDCCRKAEYYLAHEDERRLIALNGYNIVKQKHSYIQRIATILDIVNY